MKLRQLVIDVRTPTEQYAYVDTTYVVDIEENYSSGLIKDILEVVIVDDKAAKDAARRNIKEQAARDIQSELPFA